MTRPSAAMRAAMAEADVGDDDYRDDPTVAKLEERSAWLMGKDAGLFVPSGIMGNLIAALAHAADGRRVVALENSHLAWSTAGNAHIGRLVNLTTVPSDARGLPEPDRLLSTLRAPGSLPVGLICFENTHNQAGGTALAPSETEPLIAAARQWGVSLHLDGARLFNAAVALGLQPGDLTQEADSVTFCISKGLGAPVGSVLCGSSQFIDRARDFRKWLGGTMRQAGIIAAAGLFALEHGIDRLAEDHRNARLLAAQLTRIPGLQISPFPVETNIVFAHHETIDSSVLYERLRERGVLTNQIDGRIRLVTHLDVDRAQIAEAARHVWDAISVD